MNNSITKTVVTITKKGYRENAVEIDEKHSKTFFSNEKKYDKNLFDFIRRFGPRTLRTGDKDHRERNVKVTVEISHSVYNEK
jgi:hypothetical protein